MRTPFLLAFAGLCLTLALILAWALGVSLFYPSFLAGIVHDRSDLIRAHVDYLMMAQFLFLFAILFRQYTVTPPLWVVAACCYGAFFNPLGFLGRALTPKAELAAAAALPPHMPLPAVLTFTMTTIGFLAAVALIVRAAWKARAGEARARD